MKLIGKMLTSRELCIAPAILLAAGVVSCSPYTERDSLSVVDAPAFRSTGKTPLVSRWWTSFDDPALDAAVDRVLAENYSLAAAWSRLEQSRAIARRETSAQSVQLDATAGTLLRDGDRVNEESQLSLGLEASYEVDLWGRIRSLVEAERLRALASLAEYRAASVTLSAETSIVWFRLAEARSQLVLIAAQIKTNETVLEVLRERFAAGISDAVDVQRQRQLVESTREQALIVRSSVQVLRHRLAVLEGRPPQSVDGYEASELPKLAGLPDTGLPAELLERRPDVRRAFFELEASDADLAAAVRDQYPRLDLSAAIETAAENPSGLFDQWLGSIAGQLTAPVIDGERRRSEVERAQARRAELLSGYGETVLAAFREVEDALAQERYQSRRITSLESQLDLSRSSYRQLRNQYLNGAADFIDVLTALRDQQQLERQTLGARLDLVLFRVALHRALAGGFETPRELAQGGDV